MTQNPDTGEGFDAVEVPWSPEEYFDPNATDPAFPNVVGLQIRKHIWWQGNVEFYTYDTIGPVMGQGGSIITSGGTLPGGDQDQGGGPRTDAGRGKPPSEPIFIISQNICEPEYSEKDVPLLVELHGVYGFPEGICRFPLLIGDLEVNAPSNNHWTPEMVGSGEIMIPGLRTLETTGWSSIWPMDYDDSIMGITQEQFEAMGNPLAESGPMPNLLWTKRWGLVCRLVFGSPGIFADDVVITDVSYKHVHGSKDPEYTIGFKTSRTTSISSVENPDSDVDHFTTIPTTVGALNVPTPSITRPVSDRPEWSDGSTPVIVPEPPPITPDTVFTDPGIARNAQTGGKVQNPIVDVEVLPITDSRTKNGGSLAPWDIGKYESLNDVAWRMGVTWEGVQIELNGDFANTNPNQHLPAGTHLRIALSTPTVETEQPPSNSPVPGPFTGPGVPSITH
jgi:hypothetical protein